MTKEAIKAAKAEVKAEQAGLKAAAASRKAAIALREWYRAARDADQLHPNQREGRDQRLSLARDLDELAGFFESKVERRQQEAQCANHY